MVSNIRDKKQFQNIILSKAKKKEIHQEFNRSFTKGILLPMAIARQGNNVIEPYLYLIAQISVWCSGLSETSREYK